MQELWKPVYIPEFQRLYEVSSTGKVRRVGAVAEIAANHLNGYRYAQLYDKPNRKNVSIHRLVAFAFIPLVDGKLCVDHINGLRHDNRVENLRWCSHAENTAFASEVIRRTRARGEASGLAKLTREAVQMIRSSWPAKSSTELAAETGVSHTSIGNILSGRTWQHLEPNALEAENMAEFKRIGGFGRRRRASKNPRHWAPLRPNPNNPD